MSPEGKRWAWIAGLGAGAAGLIGAILLWPKKASAQSPTTGHINYVSTYSSPVFNGKVGDKMTISVPSLKGTNNMWHAVVTGTEGVVGRPTMSSNDIQNPGEIHFTFEGKGAATIWISKIPITPLNSPIPNAVEPPMAVNMNIA
jgi:hypothetical protein